MVKYSASFLEELRSRIPVSAVISRKVKLQRKGSSPQWLGLCPFHKEKTPSFTVNDDKGFYHCFGCGTSGDIIDFEMQINRLSFIEAIEKLAKEAGMVIPKSSPKEVEIEKQRANIYQVMSMTADYFHDNLYTEEGSEALEYLKKRGLNEEIIAKFKLGFAPKDPNSLTKYLKVHDVEEDMMLRAGLIKKSDNNQANYTYFRDRVMFPITDAKGRVIAFGGRIMGDGQPKYLNSPETEIFNKGENLYGLSQAISSIREFDTAILVEGYMDVISLVKAGIPYAVAPLGTALTEKQVMKLWHYTSEPAVCFDNDTAGANAMIKSALRTLPILKAGYSVKFTNVVGAKDPDEFIVARGKEAFLELDKKNLDEILWNYLVSNYRFETPEHKAKFEMEIEALLNNIKDEKVKGYYLGDFKRRLKERIYGKRLYKKDLSNNSVSKVSIKSGVNEAKSLIAYCLLFPEIAKNFVEDYYNYQVLKIELDEINNYLNKVMDILTLKKDISESELKEELEKSNLNHIYTAVSSEIEIITRKFKRKFKDESEKQKLVKQDFGLRLTNYKIFAINKEISMIKSQANNEDFLNDGTLWERYVFLKSEKEKLENLNF